MSSTSLPTVVNARSRIRYAASIGVLASALVMVDQLTKWWAETTLIVGATTPVVGEFVQWKLVYNPGAAFGLGSEFTWVLTMIAAIAVVGLLVLALRVRTPSWAVGVGLLLGGAVTHLGDRVAREPGFARGHVVDFIDYNGLFVGNVADIALVVGAALLMLLSVLDVESVPRAPITASGDVQLRSGKQQ
ncbi:MULTISPECIES: signal peptidase II [Rhodococcus]|uniref:Lipoprotein signal peptidase n=1 Tax=Rhodococcus rhodochrous TaxID=1829 RepID=A0AAW4XPX5_RHORH|nr:MULTISPECIES: signal peptidase II [Rhodococcus]AYA23375.1 signal peptidase II [Rhodococcus rhodochrous]MCD2114972.1 signal peptidase II [Rhodococcus rhodochrous]MDC3728029.1 signal peptidase II [Rhodococcus sp. Rp3]WSE25348.1 signal peptidase II [Rhodococcus sp. PD04]